MMLSQGAVCGGVRVERIPGSTIVAVSLFRNRVFECSRTEASSQFNQVAIDLPMAANQAVVGAEDLFLWLEVPQRTSNGSLKLVLDRRMFDGAFTSDDCDLSAWVTTTGVQTPNTAMSNRAKIGLYNRVSVLSRVTTSGTGVHTIEASATLLCRQWR